MKEIILTLYINLIGSNCYRTANDNANSIYYSRDHTLYINKQLFV